MDLLDRRQRPAVLAIVAGSLLLCLGVGLMTWPRKAPIPAAPSKISETEVSPRASRLKTAPLPSAPPPAVGNIEVRPLSEADRVTARNAGYRIEGNGGAVIQRLRPGSDLLVGDMILTECSSRRVPTFSELEKRAAGLRFEDQWCFNVYRRIAPADGQVIPVAGGGE